MGQIWFFWWPKKKGGKSRPAASFFRFNFCLHRSLISLLLLPFEKRKKISLLLMSGMGREGPVFSGLTLPLFQTFPTNIQPLLPPMGKPVPLFSLLFFLQKKSRRKEMEGTSNGWKSRPKLPAHFDGAPPFNHFPSPPFPHPSPPHATTARNKKF